MASFAGEDNFESYTNGNDLDGTGGGTGWNGNWRATATNVKAQNSVVYEGSMAGDIDATSGESTALRTFASACDDGSLYIAIRKAVVGTTGLSVALATGNDAVAGWRTYVTFSSGGDVISYYTTGWSSSDTLISGYSAGQWYILNFEWDYPVEGSNFRVRIHNGTSWGSFTPWRQSIQGSFTTLDRVRIANNASPSTGTSYFDIISASDPTATGGATFIPKVMWFS